MNLGHPTGDTPDKQRLREADEIGDGYADYEIPHVKREVEDLRQRFENMMLGADYPTQRRPVPKDADFIYVANGPDDYDVELTD